MAPDLLKATYTPHGVGYRKKIRCGFFSDLHPRLCCPSCLRIWDCKSRELLWQLTDMRKNSFSLVAQKQKPMPVVRRRYAHRGQPQSLHARPVRALPQTGLASARPIHAENSLVTIAGRFGR